MNNANMNLSASACNPQSEHIRVAGKCCGKDHIELSVIGRDAASRIIELTAGAHSGCVDLDVEQVRIIHDVPPIPEYDGEITITPKTEAQTLPTEGKMIRQDITVLEIPYYETSNTSGGYTAIIGA